MKYYQVFGRSTCPWCVKACSILQDNELDFMFCDMQDSPALIQYHKDLYEMETVPIVVEIDLFSEETKTIGGCTDLMKYLGVEDEQS